jgi:tetratricopeptide (TPR) repeat protein
MRKLFEQMRTRLESFLGQRRTLLLVVSAGPAEYLPLVSTIDGIEQGGSADAFWLFSEAFDNPSQYAKAVVDSFRTRYVMLAAELQKADPSAPADLPAAMLDVRRPPVDRLRELFLFARDLIDDLEATHLVVGLLPEKISAPLPYAQLIQSLAAHETPVPWCHHMRFVVREESQQALLTQHAQAMASTEFYAPNLGPEAVQGSLEDEANDASSPLPQRMQALLLLAGMDLAYLRLPAAMEKYRLLAEYHQALGPQPLHALALNGMGEVWDRSGNAKEAQQHFEMALVPALASQNEAVLINITLNLANLHRNQGRWQLAFDHYDAVSDLAETVCNPMLKLRCLEQMGFCRYKLGDHKGAWAQWNAGVVLARGVESREHLLDCLERIRNMYKELGLAARRQEVEPEVEALKRQGVRSYPA